MTKIKIMRGKDFAKVSLVLIILTCSIAFSCYYIQYVSNKYTFETLNSFAKILLFIKTAVEVAATLYVFSFFSSL